MGLGVGGGVIWPEGLLLVFVGILVFRGGGGFYFPYGYGLIFSFCDILLLHAEINSTREAGFGVFSLILFILFKWLMFF